ncbi:MAG: cobalt ECF transporter T component CbiQ, partial [Acidimicrobiia bacterium]
PEVGLCPCGCIGRRRKGDFVEKTIVGSAGLLRRTMFSEDVGAQDGLLQRLDPRVKVVSLLGLLVATALVRNVVVLVGVYALTLVLAMMSRLSLRFFVARVWLFVPIFTGIVVIPATLSFITPGRVVLPLGSWFGSPVGVTQQGLTSATLIVTRVATSISLAVLLTLTTPWPRLLGALRTLRVPWVFILVTGMAYRYLFYLLGSVTDMYTARKARTVARETDVKRGRTFVGASAGALFGKTFTLSEEVHMAMVSRGYTSGQPRRERTPIAPGAWWFLVATAVVAVTMIGVDRAIGR